MTNIDIAILLTSKTEQDLVEIANLTAENIIVSWSEQDQASLQIALDAEGIAVGGICQRKKAPPSA